MSSQVKRTWIDDHYDQWSARMSTTLTEDIAALAKDEAIIDAVNVLRANGVNGVMYDKLMQTNADLTEQSATKPLS
jgi:hypothetical protein